MNAETISLVQESWRRVEAIAPQAAALFYQNLFAADPGLRLLFRGDMKEQERKLMQMLGSAVNKLHDLDRLLPVLQDLARRHVGYGVQESDYATVGAALIKTLGQGLGADFTADVRLAWTTVYGVMSEVMIRAARSGAREPGPVRTPQS